MLSFKGNFWQDKIEFFLKTKKKNLWSSTQRSFKAFYTHTHKFAVVQKSKLYESVKVQLNEKIHQITFFMALQNQ